MKVVPLQVPLRNLNGSRLVFVQRQGLVYSYPAYLLRDIPNDLYVINDANCNWMPSALDSRVGLAVHAASVRTGAASLPALCSAAWSSGGGQPGTFAAWWESIDTTGDPAMIGTAASYAASNVMTWSLFRHRYEIDTSSESL